MDFNFNRILQATKAKKVPKGWQGHCPAHNDKNPSLSIDRDAERTLLFCHAGCSFENIVSALGSDPIPPSNFTKNQYLYNNPSGIPILRVTRTNKTDGTKSFFQERFNGKHWETGGTKDTLAPYKYSHWGMENFDQTIFLVEGEKCVELLEEIDLLATTTPGGANRWQQTYGEYFKNRKVVILPDADNAGKAYATTAAKDLIGIAKDVKIVELPGLSKGQDIYDWICVLGNTKEKLLSLIEEANHFTLEKNSQATGFSLTCLRNLLEEPVTKEQWVIENVLIKGGISIFAGKPKAGKTTLVRGIAKCVATGTPFLGRHSIKGKVLYFALEEKRDEVARHFRDLGLTGNDLIFVHVDRAPLNAVEELIKAISAHQPELVIIDPLFRFIRIKDSNDYVQVSNAFEPIVEIARKSGAHILFIHHHSKGEREGAEGILGSSAIAGAADANFIMIRKGKVRTLRSEQRYGIDLEETELIFDESRREYSLGQTKTQVEEHSIEKEIISLLETSTNPLREDEIMPKVEGNMAKKRKALRNLHKEEQIIRTGNGNRNDPFLYSITRTLVPTIYREREYENHLNGEPQ